MMTRLLLILYVAVLEATAMTVSAGLGGAILYTVLVAASPFLAIGARRRVPEPDEDQGPPGQRARTRTAGRTIVTRERA
jgi:hypothetical protein